MPLRLSDELQYGHLCSVYENETQGAADVEVFLRGGLARNEQCVHIADAGQWPKFRGGRDESGADISKAIALEQIVFISLPQLLLKQDPCDLYRVFIFLKNLARDAQRKGFQGLRAAIDMCWLRHSRATLEQLREYEQLLTDLAESMRCTWFCQHQGQQQAAHELMEVVLLHPAVLHRGVVCPNIHWRTEESAARALTLEQLLETSYREHVLPSSATLDLQRLESALTNEREFSQNVRIVRTDGTAPRLQFFARPVSRNKSDVLEFIGCLVDVATCTTAEAALRLARGELERILKVMNTGELAVAIAHEVRQSLMSVTTEAYAAIRWLSQPQPNLAEALSSLQHIVRSGHRAGDVISSMQLLVRQEARFEKQFDMNAAIVEATVLLERALHDNGVHLRRELSPDIPLIYGHRLQLEQVMLNLITNAIEAIAARSGSERDILVRSWIESGQQIHVSVRDTGIGLTDAAAAMLFKSFATTKPRGMGLGLSISRTIIDAHNGRLWASRNEDQEYGATFHITLPLDAPRAI